MTANRARLADGQEIEFHTLETVKLRMEEAADTLKRLRVSGCRPGGYKTAWPDIVQDFWDAYGDKDEEPRLGPPRAAAIDRMDEVMQWLAWIENPTHRGVVWGRACGFRVAKISRVLGLSRYHVEMAYRDALEGLLRRLNAHL